MWIFTSNRARPLLQPPPKLMLTIHKFGLGGADRVCAFVARGFAEAGFDTEVISFSPQGDGSDALEPLFGDQVQLTYLAGAGVSRTRDLVRQFPAFVGHLNKARPDIVMSTGNAMNWITALGRSRAASTACRLVLKTTNPIIRANDSGLVAMIRAAGYARAFSSADRVLTLSDAETRQLRAAFPGAADRFRTVINPYVTPRMLAADAPAAVPRIILGVGRFEPQKRFDLLLRAFARSSDQQSRLVLLGDGADRPALQALAVELGIAERLEMPGFVTDVAPWFARASLFILSSNYEGLPAVVLEAMAANCPVISTDCFPAARALVGTAEGCAVLESADAIELAQLMDARVGLPRPTQIRAIAERYSINNAIRSHVAEVQDLL